MPPDYGPNPDRSVTGSFAPGTSTGLVIVDSVTFGSGSWGQVPTVAMIVATLGSLAAGVKTDVAGITFGGSYLVKFCAERSSDGASVLLTFEMRKEFGGGYVVGYQASQPWGASDQPYAWATRTPSAGDRIMVGETYGKTLCLDATSGTGDYSTANHLVASSTMGLTLDVAPGAPSDLRVTYGAAWFNEASPQIPDATQLVARLGIYTCPVLPPLLHIPFKDRLKHVSI